MKFYVGTSGYSYFWNEGKKDQLGWYISKGFKTVEINSTFYSFPSKAAIKRWSKVSDFFYSVKVNRLITHYLKLSKSEPFLKFYNLFEPMLDKVKLWLFQMPPSFGCTEKNLERIKSFYESISVKGKLVIEFRDPCWWDLAEKISNIGYVFCSVSAPGLPNQVVNSNGLIYFRFHGETEWYSYVYSEAELMNYYKAMKNSGANEAYVYFNNDTGMLENALFFLSLVSSDEDVC